MTKQNCKYISNLYNLWLRVCNIIMLNNMSQIIAQDRCFLNSKYKLSFIWAPYSFKDPQDPSWLETTYIISLPPFICPVFFELVKMVDVFHCYILRQR